jgi:hypothetical protein
VRLGIAIAAVGLAFVASSGVAHAEETLRDRKAAAAEVPWYERFTYSAGAPKDAPAWSSANPRTGASQTPAPNARWGLTLNLGDEDRIGEARRVQRQNDEAAVGAFFRFTPRMRLGGKVSVGLQAVAPGLRTSGRDEQAAGVKLESAFKF